MAVCSCCGAETFLFLSQPPICIRCFISRGVDRDTILKILREQLERAQQRRTEANRRFHAVLSETEIPSGMPQPDGTHRIRQAARHYEDALRAVNLAVYNLNNFVMHGTLPSGPDVRKEPAAEEKKPPKKETG